MRKPVSLVRADTYRDIHGRRITELKGNLRGIPKHDRPPRFILESIAMDRKILRQTGPNRKALKQRYPGRPIEELKGREVGAVAILHNGPSLKQSPLNALQIPTIGMNRTLPQSYPDYLGPVPTYYCFADHPWGLNLEVVEGKGMIVINGSSLESDPSQGRHYRATKSYRMAPFSHDLARDGYVSWVPCTTGFLALQLALYLGFTRIYLLGLDLSGTHFNSTPASVSMPDALKHYEVVSQNLKKVRPDVQVWVCNSPQSLVHPGIFPHAPLSQLLQETPELQAQEA